MPNKINEALQRQVGQTVTHINNYSDIGVIELWLNNETCIHIAGNGNADINGEPELSISVQETKTEITHG